VAEHARKCLKVEYLGRIEYEIQKSRVTGPWDHMVSVSAKKVKKKISCLCTFKPHKTPGQWYEIVPLTELSASLSCVQFA
jgi:hypothetical protein